MRDNASVVRSILSGFKIVFYILGIQTRFMDTKVSTIWRANLLEENGKLGRVRSSWGTRATWGCEPQGVAKSNIRRTHKYRNLQACKPLSFYGNVGTFWNRRRSPPPGLNPLMFLCWGDIPQSTQSNKKLVVHVFEKEKYVSLWTWGSDM
jgi:hypothetical protein